MLKIIPDAPALLLRNRSGKTLVAPDLHLGYEKTLTSKGINMPSQTNRIYIKMQKLVRQYKPQRIIFLGDIKHGTGKILTHEWTEIPDFFEKLLTEVDDLLIIPGNHDGGLKALLPSCVTLIPTKGMSLMDDAKKIYLMHGHTWPSPEAFMADIIIMGHHHFAVEFKESSGTRSKEPIWVVTKYDVKRVIRSYLQYRNICSGDDPVNVFRKHFKMDPGRPNVIIMPTFNHMLSGTPLNKPRNKYLGPIFRSDRIKLEDSDTFLLDGTYIQLH